MKIILLTSKNCRCTEVEQELIGLGFGYKRYDVEDRPELARWFGIRQFPTLIVDECRVIPIEEDNTARLKQLLTVDLHKLPIA